jgi:nucleotide-binding universal stress UspA family protein
MAFMNACRDRTQNTIILSHDFSEASFNAAVFAAGLAKKLNCKLLLFHVVILRLNTTEELKLIPDTVALIEKAKAKLVQQKAEIAVQCGAAVAITTCAVCGNYFTELQKICLEISPYAVVTGSNKSLSGRRNAYIMRHLPWTCITVPTGVCFFAIEKIGLACDFRGIIYEMPLEEIKALVTQLQAELHIVSVRETDKFDPVIEFESGLLKHRLKEIAPFYHVIHGADTSTAICDAVCHHQLNLLIVMPKQHTLWQRLFHKSESKKIILKCPVPVMVIH